MILAKDLGYLAANDGLLKDSDEVGKMLHGLITSVGSR